MQDGLGEGMVGKFGGARLLRKACATGFEDGLHESAEIFLDGLGVGMVLTEFF